MWITQDCSITHLNIYHQVQISVSLLLCSLHLSILSFICIQQAHPIFSFSMPAHTLKFLHSFSPHRPFPTCPRASFSNHPSIPAEQSWHWAWGQRDGQSCSFCQQAQMGLDTVWGDTHGTPSLDLGSGWAYKHKVLHIQPHIYINYH